MTRDAMTPRSLVGMTMGARKRCGADYLHALTINRLGKRLRPCPGCANCIPGLLAGAWEYCNGNGVLPARAKKVRR